jgi:hypothetical protein
MLKAREAAEKAVALDHSLAEAHAALCEKDEAFAGLPWPLCLCGELRRS